jgi:uncharacterized membrane protein YphA (DoxX/SURF4 family)
MKENHSDGAVASTILRLGLATVFLAFGIWKAHSPVAWVIFMPNWVAGAVTDLESIDALGVLRLMGFLEAILGLQLLLGLFTRATAFLCTLLLGGIVIHVGFDQIGVRDLGLMATAFALSFVGGGPWSLDRWLDAEAASEE